jgi:hypothetical protein
MQFLTTLVSPTVKRNKYWHNNEWVVEIDGPVLVANNLTTGRRVERKYASSISTFDYLGGYVIFLYLRFAIHFLEDEHDLRNFILLFPDNHRTYAGLKNASGKTWCFPLAVDSAPLAQGNGIAKLRRTGKLATLYHETDVEKPILSVKMSFRSVVLGVTDHSIIYRKAGKLWSIDASLRKRYLMDDLAGIAQWFPSGMIQIGTSLYGVKQKELRWTWIWTIVA